MDLSERFRSLLSAFLEGYPVTSQGVVANKKVPISFGTPRGGHETTTCWVYRPTGVPDLEMFLGFYSNFTDHDLICKVLPVDTQVVPGIGASLQLNADECLREVGPDIALTHHGRVTLTSAIARNDLVADIAQYAGSGYDALGGDITFSSWPITIGSTRFFGALLDRLFLYAFCVEQVKRSRRGEDLLPAWRLQDRRRYWFNVHWPPEKGKELNPDVLLADGTEDVGADLAVGDLVWIFESKTGRDRDVINPDGTKQPLVREVGRRAVVALSEIVERLQAIDVPAQTYKDGSEKWWRWRARGRLVRSSGYIAHERANQLLGYNANNSMRGFGTRHSGLMELSRRTHDELLTAYCDSDPQLPVSSLPGKRGGPGGEGAEHRLLKERVAADPAGILGEAGLRHIKTEFPFQTGDRADIILEDGIGRFIGVEVEVTVDLDDLSGVLQAIKYPRMYALVAGRPYAEGRSFLVAHSISAEVKALCRKYDVECFEVRR
jgi:hypothetical protein